MTSRAPHYREDLRWHEQPRWYLLAAVCCAIGALALGIGLVSLTRRAAIVWVTFLYVVGGLAFGDALGPRYLAVTRALWVVHRRSRRPMWLLAEGRQVAIELSGGWFLAAMVGWRLGHVPPLAHAVSSIVPYPAWGLGIGLGVQFGLWSGVTLMWPIYRWLAELPPRPEAAAPRDPGRPEPRSGRDSGPGL